MIGAGHAGCEAAITTALLVLNTALFSLNLDRIAWQPCNPAIGGPAKSQLVYEVDALGGMTGRLGPPRPNRQVPQPLPAPHRTTACRKFPGSAEP